MDLVQMADKRDVEKNRNFKYMTNNNGIEIYIEKDTLSTLNSIEELIIDGKGIERYGQKTARLTLIKNYLKK
ncbi:MAG: hypothetical protein R6W84_04245 [Promethearchaeia archaeon]